VNAVERLQAAIEKLESIRGTAPDPWTAEPRRVVDVNGTIVASTVTSFDAAGIVTLHRTIDAQLAILRAGLEQGRAVERFPHYWYTPPTDDALALADAILGGAS